MRAHTLKPLARAYCATRTPVDVIPVMHVTRRRAPPDDRIASPASHPAAIRTLAHYSCVSRPCGRPATDTASTRRPEASMVGIVRPAPALALAAPRRDPTEMHVHSSLYSRPIAK